MYFDQCWFVFLYCKDTSPVLKYPVFVKFSKNVLFSCIRSSLSNIYIYIYKYYNIIFSHNRGNFKNNICISMHFGFNNQFIQAMRTRPIFQKF